MRRTSRVPEIAAVAFGATLVLAALICVMPASPIADEWVHALQAQAFAQGNWQIHTELSTWPTMNLFVAAPLAVLGTDSLSVARAAIAAFALLAVVGFFLLAAHFDPRSASIKTGQFFLLPIVLPYCGLVYTDIPALAAIVWMTYGAVKQRFATFAVAAVFAVAFRQVNVVWFAVGVVLYAYELRRSGAPDWAKRSVPLAGFGVCVIIAWALIVWRLGGIALTTTAQNAHRLQFHGLPNIEFAIGLGGVLFAPILLSTRVHMLQTLRRPRWALLLIVGFVFVGLTFLVKHPFNTEPDVIEGFLRNRILFEIAHTPLRWVFATVVAIAAFGFCLLPFCRGAAQFKIPLYAIGTAALLPFELIEQRYYLPLMTLVWAFRAPVSEALERAQLAVSAGLTIAVLVLVTNTGMFL